MGVRKSAYPYRFYLPAGAIYIIIFIVPTAFAFFFSMTRWTLFDWHWIGFDNFRQFFKDPALKNGLKNTLIYSFVTSSVKVVLGLLLGVLVTSKLKLKGVIRSLTFFPVLVSSVAVGITFKVFMNPSTGLINKVIKFFGFAGPKWLTDPDIALLSVAFVDIWKGIGLALVIYIAGILSIPQELTEAVAVDGGNSWHRFWHLIVPLSWPATSTVITLSFIGGLRSFDLIQTMTGGGPGFTTEVIASTIYKQYQAGFYGLATAGNVILFFMVMLFVIPLRRVLARKEVHS